MANRRCLQLLTRHASAAIFSTKPLKIAPSFLSQNFYTHASITTHFFTKATHPYPCTCWSHSRYLSSDSRNGNGDDDTEDDDDDADDDDEDEEDYESEDDGILAPSRGMQKKYTKEEKEAEAAAIGYIVEGPLDQSTGFFKPYEPVFAVVQIGSHQFKVSNGDSIFTERLKFCDVNDKLTLNKVLLLGSSSQTIVGRPTVPSAVVQAVVEEHALDAKVIIFKKKRRKNYRRTNGHRQELTKLRIVHIQGIDKPETIAKPSKPAVGKKKQEKVAVAA